MAFTKITNAGFGLTTGTLVGVAASFSSTVSVGGTLTYEDVTNVDSVGLITARNGIEVTDKGVQVGTGATVDSAAANTLTFLTGGSEALRIDSSGKVGLGTDNPNKILKVEYPDPGSGSDGLTQKDTGNDTTTFFGTVGPSYNYIGHSGHAGMVYSSRDLAIGVDHNNSGVIKFYTGNAERLRITSDGKVVAGGNGTGYPSRLQSHGAGNLLDLNSTSGACVIKFYESGSGRFDIRTNNGSSGLNFYDSLNGIERVRIDSSGNIGVGLANPAHQLELGNGDSTIRLNATAGGNAALKFLTNTGNVGQIVFGDTDDDDIGFIQYAHSDNSLRFAVNASERMRITNGSSNGADFFFNCTSSPSTSVHGSAIKPNNAFGNFYLSMTSRNLAYSHASFGNTNGVVGSIHTNGSATLFNTSSDYRLKENVIDLDGAITRVKQLAPKRFNFIADDSTTVDGFLAHEAQTVVPEAVTGEHNAVKVWQEGEELPDGVSVGDNKLDEDGNTIPDYQGIDQSKLVPLLTAALQEAITKIETLEAQNADLLSRVAALEV